VFNIIDAIKPKGFQIEEDWIENLVLTDFDDAMSDFLMK